MERCNTFIPNYGSVIEDLNGCMKNEGHEGPHCFVDKDKNIRSWEYDYSCTCGCFNDLEKDNTVGCLITDFL